MKEVKKAKSKHSMIWFKHLKISAISKVFDHADSLFPRKTIKQTNCWALLGLFCCKNAASDWQILDKHLSYSAPLDMVTLCIKEVFHHLTINCPSDFSLFFYLTHGSPTAFVATWPPAATMSCRVGKSCCSEIPAFNHSPVEGYVGSWHPPIIYTKAFDKTSQTDGGVGSKRDFGTSMNPTCWSFTCAACVVRMPFTNSSSKAWRQTWHGWIYLAEQHLQFRLTKTKESSRKMAPWNQQTPSVGGGWRPVEDPKWPLMVYIELLVLTGLWNQKLHAKVLQTFAEPALSTPRRWLFLDQMRFKTRRLPNLRSSSLLAVPSFLLTSQLQMLLKPMYEEHLFNVCRTIAQIGSNDLTKSKTDSWNLQF